MTRIFGVERNLDNLNLSTAESLAGPNKVIFTNLQAALERTYQIGWQAYAMGFLVVDEDGVHPYSVYKGYRGLTAEMDVQDVAPTALVERVAKGANNLFFAVLENEPDEGLDAFLANEYDPVADTFPLESENWFVITMGDWSNQYFDDQDLGWYDGQKPWRSINNYLETNPDDINFNWVDKRRTPFIVAVNKDGQRIEIDDQYSSNNSKGYKYSVVNNEIFTSYRGVLNQDGFQV